MHIKHIEIGNFRKLLAVRIDFSEETTVFVGANNSGKTSAMTALQKFLVRPKSFSTHDFTLSHWKKNDQLGAAWEKEQAANGKLCALDRHELLPFLDVWLAVKKNELHQVQQLLPTLDWNGEPIGVRLSFGPKNEKELETFQQAYLKARAEAKAILAQSAVVISQTLEAVGESAPAKPFALWPQSMMAFLERKLHSVFSVHAYLLDPAQLKTPENGLACPQQLPLTSEPLDGDPFKGIIRIDYEPAHRGFSDGDTALGNGQDGEVENANAGKKLSMQLRAYYAKHLDLSDRPEPQDIQALHALHSAEAICHS